MSQFNVFLALISLSLTLSSSLWAQEIRPVECRFLALEEKPGALINSAGEGKEITIEILKGRISKPVPCFSVDGRINFLDASSREVLASTAVPSKVKKVILIFLKVPGKDSWKIVPFENSPSEFPIGGTRVVNLHSADIRFILGEVKEVLKPVQSKGFQMPTERNDFNMAPVVFQFKNKEEKWVTGKETSYRFLPAIRYIFIAYIDPQSKRPRVKTFKDTFRPPAPAQ